MKIKLTVYSIIQLIILLVTVIIARIIKNPIIIFVSACLLLAVDIVYHAYAYHATYRDNEREQLTVLRDLRSALYNYVVPGIFVYSLFFLCLDYKSPIEDLDIVVFGRFLAVSIISLIVCIIMINRKKQELANGAVSKQNE